VVRKCGKVDRLSVSEGIVVVKQIGAISAVMSQQPFQAIQMDVADSAWQERRDDEGVVRFNGIQKCRFCQCCQNHQWNSKKMQSQVMAAQSDADTTMGQVVQIPTRGRGTLR